MSSHQETLGMLKKKIKLQLFNFRSHNQNWGFVRKMGVWLQCFQRETPSLHFRSLKIKTKQKSYSGAQDVWLVVRYESTGSKLNSAEQVYTDNQIYTFCGLIISAPTLRDLLHACLHKYKVNGVWLWNATFDAVAEVWSLKIWLTNIFPLCPSVPFLKASWSQ